MNRISQSSGYLFEEGEGGVGVHGLDTRDGGLRSVNLFGQLALRVFFGKSFFDNLFGK